MDICIHDEYCGGCIYQGTPYEEQLRIKEKEVMTYLEKNGISPAEYLGIEAAPYQYRYRNKMEYTFGDMVKDGPLCLGMHKLKNFMSIVTVDECQLVHENFNVILRAVIEFCNEKGYVQYHKKKHTGNMRNLIIRQGYHTGEILVNIVTTSGFDFDEEGFVEMIKGLPLQNSLAGILRTVNDDIADTVKCDELRLLWGRDYYREKIMGLDFNVSAFSFFQTNIAAVERLYTEAVDMIDDCSGKKVFDLYCGTGTITQTLALKAKETVGVEIVKEAADAARESAKMNGLANCSFIAGDVFEVLSDLDYVPDVIVVDPPRVGIHPKAMKKIASYGVEQILYISCNPKTLAPDLAGFVQYGYEVSKLKAYDNFPMTKHTECVCLLSKKAMCHL